MLTQQIIINAAKKDSLGSSEEETSTAMAQSGHFTHKLEESDDDFNSNQYSPDTATLSVSFKIHYKKQIDYSF